MIYQQILTAVQPRSRCCNPPRRRCLRRLTDISRLDAQEGARSAAEEQPLRRALEVSRRAGFV